VFYRDIHAGESGSHMREGASYTPSGRGNQCSACSNNLMEEAYIYAKSYILPSTEYRQSTRPFLQSLELGPPAPSPAGECVPSPLVPGGGDTLACGRGGGGVLIRTRRQTLWYSRYKCNVLCGVELKGSTLDYKTVTS
jgi:hypothetical protein